MLAIPPINCPPAAIEKLRALQDEVNSHATFEERKATAERLWSNRTDNRPFEAVKAALLTLCPNGYCCYCETNEPSPVEHIWPKSLYPERAFLWTNYLFSCHNCNSKHKLARWAIFRAAIGADFEQEASWAGTPISGDPVFLDLRAEDPQALIRLDFETFLFEADTTDLRECARVDYTINQVLKLNERGLDRAREFAYDGYCERLARLAELPTEKRAAKAQLFQGVPQRTVWKEMQRWHQRVPRLTALFSAAPEALTW